MRSRALSSRVAAFLLLGACLVIDAGGQETAARHPSFRFLRQDEDWSTLKGQEPWSAWEAWKYVPFDDEGHIWASFGGDARVRAEGWNNFAFGAAPPGARTDDTFVLERILLHGDLHVGDGLRLYVEGKHAGQPVSRDLPGGRRPLDVDSLDLQQGFLDLGQEWAGGGRWTLRVGRQMLKYGHQRLVSPLPWGNSLRAWDGVAAILENGPWTVTAFWTMFAPVQKYDFNDGDRDQRLAGVYAAGKVPGTQADWDLYLLSSSRDGVTVSGTTGDEDRWTLGSRLAGRCDGWDGEIEAAGQVGEVGSEDVRAGMLALEGGFTWTDRPWSPRLHAGLDYATGDHRTGGSVQTFDQLHPLGHAWLGTMDLVGRQNILDVRGGLTVTPRSNLTTRLDLHTFWLADEDDALYQAGGGVLRPATASGDRFVGIEVDLNLRKVFRPGLVGEAGYGHFFAGDVIEDSGPSRDTDFLYLSLTLQF